MMENNSEKTGSPSAQKKNEERDFDRWNSVKKQRQTNARMHYAKKGEVWWVTIGKNIGVEMNGKGSCFTRPVLVFKKLTRHGFLAIPLTTKKHDDNRHSQFVLDGRDEYAALGQLRVISSFRLLRKIGKVSEEAFRKVENDLFDLYFY